MKEEYLKVLYDNKIKAIYHFTNISNLESIMKYGICNRKYMNENKINYEYTDANRFDKQIDCISLSINQTNKSMLMSKTNKFYNDWIIIELDAEQIINNFYNEICYCKNNAASSEMINLLKNNKEYLKSVLAFKNMFENNKNYSQGELLLEGNIPFEFVTNIYVKSLQEKLIVYEILEENNKNSRVNVIIKKEMF